MGFHAKTIIVDGKRVGRSANWDVRARLNFEANAFFYDAAVGPNLRAFEDLAVSTGSRRKITRHVPSGPGEGRYPVSSRRSGEAFSPVQPASTNFLIGRPRSQRASRMGTV